MFSLFNIVMFCSKMIRKFCSPFPISLEQCALSFSTTNNHIINSFCMNAENHLKSIIWWKIDRQYMVENLFAWSFHFTLHFWNFFKRRRVSLRERSKTTRTNKGGGGVGEMSTLLNKSYLVKLSTRRRGGLNISKI